MEEGCGEGAQVGRAMKKGKKKKSGVNEEGKEKEEQGKERKNRGRKERK